MASRPPRVDEFQVTGAQLLSKLKDLIHQGNIRRISIRNEAGVTLLEIPLVLGLAGAVFVPVWAAIGAFAALVAKCTLVVERVDDNEPRSTGSAAEARKPKPRKPTSRSRAA